MKCTKKNKMKFNLLIMVCLIFLLGCKSNYETQNFKLENSPKKPDYNLSSSWAVLPSTYSSEFQNYASKAPDTLQADVSYVYPTLNLITFISLPYTPNSSFVNSNGSSVIL